MNFKKMLGIGVGVIGLAGGLKAAEKTVKSSIDIEKNIHINKVPENPGDTAKSEEVYKMSATESKYEDFGKIVTFENKDYKMDTLQVVEKNGQNYVLLIIKRKNGEEINSYQEIIEAAKQVNPNFRFLTPEETEKLLKENKTPKRPTYVALGVDVTGSETDTKAAPGVGTQFNSYTKDRDSFIKAGTNKPTAGSIYYYPVVIKSKNQNPIPDGLALNK